MRRLYIGAKILTDSSWYEIKDFYVSESTGSLHAVLSHKFTGGSEVDSVNHNIDLELDEWTPEIKVGDELYVHEFTGQGKKETLNPPHYVKIVDTSIYHSDLVKMSVPIDGQDFLDLVDDRCYISTELNNSIVEEIQRIKSLYVNRSEAGVYDSPKETYFEYGGDLEAYTGTKITDKSIDFTPKVDDKIYKPKHYNFGDIEVIDFIDQVVAHYPPKQAYYIGNVIKYISRATKKDSYEDDLLKAENYLHRAIHEKWNDEI